MGLLTLNREQFISNVKVDSDTDTLGDLGEATLTVDPNVQPKALTCRKIPHALRDKVKAEIDTLVNRNILVPVSKPTKWVSQMAVVHKPNGKLRICIDHQALNSALQREHYPLPVLNDVLPKVEKAKLFSKLEVKEAFWHVRLDETSSELTTMITSFGRFRWARLPFGLKVSSVIFQRELTEALNGLDGIFPITDDIIIAGCGQTEEDAKRDNSSKLEQLYKRCKEAHIVLNKDKMEIGLKEISFHDHKISSTGVKADENKVKAILNMSNPVDVTSVIRFFVMVQNLAKFLPSLSTTLEPIRALTRKDVVWNLSTECENAFKEVKEKLTITPILAYFNPG